MINMSDFVIENGTLIEYVGPGGEVAIPEGVTAIKSGMFSGPFMEKDSIQSVIIPTSMTSIDAYTFKRCKNLTSVQLHEGVTNIGEWAFDQCSALTNINVPIGITQIGYKAFYDCSSLQDKDGFVIVGDILYQYYGMEENVTIPVVKKIESGAFEYNRNIRNVVIPDGVERIEGAAFRRCINLQSVVVPDSILFIAQDAFSGCTALKDSVGFSIVKDRLYGYMGNDKRIIIPETVKYISDSVFDSMLNIEEVIFPNHTVEINYGVFYGCSNLKSITMTIDTLTVSAKRNMIFGETGKTIELDLIGENNTHRKVIGVFRKSYYTQQWAYEDDYLAPLTQEDLPNYDRLIATGEFEGFKANEQGRLKAMVWRLTEMEYPVATEYREMFAEFLGGKFSKVIKMAEEDGKSDYVYAAIKAGAVTDANKKKITNALKKSSMDELVQIAGQIDTIMADTQETAPTEELACGMDKKYLEQLKKINAKAVLLKSNIEELPDVPLADGTGMAPVQYLQLCLAEYISQYKETIYAFNPIADEVAGLLDKDELARVVTSLYENASPESIQLTFLPAVFRFADGITVEKVYRRYKAVKWMENTINNCLLLSNTREAMLLAEKNKLLDNYADVRGMDGDYIRYTALYDFGFDDNGQKLYDLGTKKLEVIINTDLTLALFDSSTGKSVKTVPKKDIEPELYTAISADFSDMKKNMKKAIKTFTGHLFRMYLDGTGTSIEQWRAVYLHNPILQQVANLLVWSQGGKNFTLKDGVAIDCKEQPYELGADDVFVAHPLEMTEKDIKEWQKYFVSHGIKQPFEQIWEPVIDFGYVKEDRYNDIEIPAYRFKGQEKHGITFRFDYGSSDLDVELNDCRLEYDGGTAVRRHDLDLQGNLVLGKFHAKKSRASNHIIGLLDRWTIYGRILKSDNISVELLQNATLAQITGYLKFASENNCFNATAILLDYKNRTFDEFDPMEEFTLEL